MAIVINCSICNRELDRPGQWWFSSPDENGDVSKDHFCRSCGDIVAGTILRLWLEHN